jgi:hypothetical protein
MRVVLAKNQSQNFRIESGVKDAPVSISVTSVAAADDGKLSVNLRYYRRKHECLSQWQKDELKALSNWIEKIAERTLEQVTAVTKTCHAHQGPPKESLYPPGVSLDIKMYGLDVGPKASVHGFFSNSQFFVVRLDRSHAVHG